MKVSLLRKRNVLFALFLMGILLLSGCGGGGGIAGKPSEGSIEGSVYFESLTGDAQPMVSGQVTVTGPQQVVGSISSGKFLVTGLGAGTYKVVLSSYTTDGSNAVIVITPKEWIDVTVLQGTKTTNVNFFVQAMPPLPEL